jgi:hypothetical protein
MGKGRLRPGPREERTCSVVRRIADRSHHQRRKAEQQMRNRRARASHPWSLDPFRTPTEARQEVTDSLSRRRRRPQPGWRRNVDSKRSSRSCGSRRSRYHTSSRQLGRAQHRRYPSCRRHRRHGPCAHDDRRAGVVASWPAGRSRSYNCPCPQTGLVPGTSNGSRPCDAGSSRNRTTGKSSPLAAACSYLGGTPVISLQPGPELG